MRKTIGVLVVLVVAVTACSSRDAKMSEDLQKDLALASSSDGITLAPSAAPARTGISAIERTSPTPPRPAPSQRARQHRRVQRSAEVAPVEVAEAPEEEPAPEPQPAVETEPESDEPAPASTRPRPVEGGTVATGGDMGGGSVGRGGGNTGIAIQIGIGVLGAILRGGVVEGDRCDPRVGRRGPVGGGPVIGPNGPIMRGPTYYVVTGTR